MASAAALTVLIAGFGTALVWRFHVSALHDLDASVQTQALAIASSLNDATTPTLRLPAGQSDVVQVLDGAGTVVASSSDLEGESKLFDFVPAAMGTQPRVVTRRVMALDDARYRVAAVSVKGMHPRTVYVGLPLRQVDDSTANLAAALLVGGPAMLALLTGLTWLLAGRALRPIEQLRAQAASISAEKLHQRLAVPPSGDEVGRLAVTFNDLLYRVDRAMLAQRAFVADAAHELRSPVAALRAQLEASELAGSPPPVPTLIAESVRLSSLVDDLLALARLDSKPALQKVEVDLDDVLLTEARLLRAHTSLAVDTSGVHPVRVLGDPLLLARMVRNLLDNASRHARQRIRVELGTRVEREVALVVEDDGAGVPTADRLRIFERFTRLEDARDRDSAGAGLGLPIVHEIATNHGGHVSVVDSYVGARFEVRLNALEVAQQTGVV